MAARPDTTISRGLVRRAIDFRRCPWVRPLVSDYADRFDSVSALFAGNPSDPDAWRSTIARVRSARRHRDVVADALADQLERRGAPPEARRAAQSLRAEATVAVVTGQQAGTFGGPLYTLLKAVTSIQIARRVEREHKIPVVPVFWVDAEDHDWEEIRTASALDADYHLVEISLHSVPGAGTQPVGSLTFDGDVSRALAELERTLPPTEFTADLTATLGRRYRPGATIGAAFAGWMEDLFGRHGLVVFDAADARVKPAVADLFVRELSSPASTSQLVRAAGRVMSGLGHAPQVEPAEDGVNLFYLDTTGRRPIRVRDGRFVIGEVSRSPADLTAEAGEYPERFSPNVVLRPIVQDRLFPTLCYVAGPSELAYQAQLGGVYRAFGVEPPLLQSRASATVLDSASARFLERHDVPFEALQAQDESVLNQLLERQLPASIERIFGETERDVAARTVTLREAITAVDPTLAGAVETTGERMRETLRSLHAKIIHASKKKDETLRRQFQRTRELAFPGGQPQERLLSIAYFANRYGPAVVDRLIDELPHAAACHYLVTL
jgi:bacillithiol biosynthesis cysteine-adding enzyme BshC